MDVRVAPAIPMHHDAHSPVPSDPTEAKATVPRVAAVLPGSPRVEGVNPTTLAGVHAMFRRVGDLIAARPEAEAEAEAPVAALEATAAAIARRGAGRARPRTLVLEWFDPPSSSVHWNPEVALAGGVETIGRPGARSRRLTSEEVAGADPEVIVLSPCGFTLERTERELPAPRVRILFPIRASEVMKLPDVPFLLSSGSGRVPTSLVMS